MKRENTIKQITIWLVSLLLCVFCVTYYRLELILTGKVYHEIKNMSLYILIALPALYLSVGGIVGLIFQYWSNNYISTKTQRYCVIVAISFILIYVATLISFKTTITPNWMLQGISYYPISFIIPGILLSIGLSYQTS
ncbi:MAG: hypothetical protein RBR71_13510 [Gudongella sp.]|nr:hypothetical protein [Gudongella sp.]